MEPSSTPPPAAEPAAEPAVEPSVAPLTEPGAGPAPEPARVGVAIQVKLAVAAAVLLAGLAVFWPRGAKTYPAPAVTALDAADQPVAVATRFKPVTLLHFWGTWCPPCVTEIPKLRAFAGAHAADPRFALVMVAVEDSPQRVSDFLGADEAKSVLYDAKWEAANRYGTTKLPETYLIVDGEVVEKWVGATDWDTVPIQSAILRHLGGS